jgi:CheY-like chemotaxis protein
VRISAVHILTFRGFFDLESEILKPRWLPTAQAGDEVLCRVRDNGVGLPSDKLASVFDVFSQIGERKHMADGGLGIGLALVRNLVELHDGRVEAHSAGLGRGSEFVVRLPSGHGPDLVKHSMPMELESAKTIRALLIDDDYDVSESFCLLLESLGAVARVAHDGPSGLAAINEFEPNLIFVDLGMPNMDGYETARRIRDSALRRDFLLIALTGWGQEEDRQRARDAGFDLHLTKPAPVDAIEELFARVERRLDHNP